MRKRFGVLICRTSWSPYVSTWSALREYVEQGHTLSLETAYIAEDRGTITIGIDLSLFHPILSEASRQRFGQQDCSA